VEHHTKTGPQVVRRNADDLLSVAADKAFHKWATKYEFYALGVEPFILQRGSRPIDPRVTRVIDGPELTMLDQRSHAVFAEFLA
jgi:hypothetical protein